MRHRLDSLYRLLPSQTKEGSRYRSALECKFLEQVEEDLTQFWSICRDHSVLVFPPLSACYRFLIHQLVGQSSKLQSVSLGQGRDRRTVVYFAPKRDPDKMAHSPSTSQKTFFGRGRGRRPRRPDQELYVPGALRKAKCDQLKENESTESAINSTESKSENRDISKGNKDSCNNAVPSTLFTSHDGHDDTIIPKSTVHESQTDECSFHSTLSTSEKEDDSIIDGTEKTSLDTTVQDANGPSHLFIDEQVFSANKKSVRENMKESDSDPVVTTSENLTSNDSVKEYDDMPQVRDERDESVVKTLHKITDDQSLHTISEKESSNGETNRNRDVVVNYVISQTPMVTSQITNDSVEKSLLTAEDENSDNLNIKPFTENIIIPSNKTQEIVKSETNCENVSVEETLEEESSSLGIENQCFQDDSLKTTIEGSAALAADCDATVDFGNEDKVEWNERRKGNKETFQSHCVSVDKEGQKHAVKHIEEDVTNFKMHDNGITIEEELTISEKASKAVCRNAGVNSSVNSSVVSSDVVNATSSNDTNENLESENSKSGSGNSIDIKDEKIRTMPKTIEHAPGSVRTEFNENAGDVETEQQKTSKKKKGKKNKSKEQTEDKIKSKEKVEKKRKKEKKNVKDKIDKEVNLDSVEEKKSKLTVKSAKEQDKKNLSTCQVATAKKMVTDSSCTEESFSAKNDDDDDNWESNFDESGDCLNPEYLEELSRLTGIANPEVHKTQYDYYSFKPREIELDDEDFGHILEIYNFSPELQTQDLMQALSSFRDKGFDIKWVDDTHALAVFASRHAAQDAIQSCSGPLMKLRPVSEGITESKKKAHHCFEFLQPYRERPQTSKLLADRLVTGALGMRSKMTREERVKEREKIKEAKSKREQEKIQKAQIWGD